MPLEFRILVILVGNFLFEQILWNIDSMGKFVQRGKSDKIADCGVFCMFISKGVSLRGSFF
jgi:hypothetical protein